MTGECLRGKESKTPPTDGRESGRKRQRTREKAKSAPDCESSEDEKRNGMETSESGLETVTGMEPWQDMGVPLPIIRALKELGFTSPTEIQRQAIPVAMDTNRDVIGAAETVSYD